MSGISFSDGIGGSVLGAASSTAQPASDGWDVGSVWDSLVGGVTAIGDSALDLMVRYDDLTRDDGAPERGDTANPKAVPDRQYVVQQPAPIDWNKWLMVGLAGLLIIVVVVLLLKLL